MARILMVFILAGCTYYLLSYPSKSVEAMACFAVVYVAMLVAFLLKEREYDRHAYEGHGEMADSFLVATMLLFSLLLGLGAAWWNELPHPVLVAADYLTLGVATSWAMYTTLSQIGYKTRPPEYYDGLD